MLISYVLPHVVGAAAFSWLFDSNFGGMVNYLINALTGGASGAALVHRRLAQPDHHRPQRHLVHAALRDADDPGRAAGGVRRRSSRRPRSTGPRPCRRHLHVIIPSIRGVLGFALLIFTMDVIRIFDSLIPLAPNAIPIGNESIMLYIYNVAFREGRPTSVWAARSAC